MSIIYVFLYQNLKKRGLISVSLNISIYVFLYQNLKAIEKNKMEFLPAIYVFLYQNLKNGAGEGIEITVLFMYFYIRI